MEVFNDRKIVEKWTTFSDCKIDYVIYAIIECHDQKSVCFQALSENSQFC